MIICTTCLMRSFTNPPHEQRVDLCEFCGAEEACSDIPARDLTPTESTLRAMEGESDAFLQKIIEADKRETADPKPKETRVKPKKQEERTEKAGRLHILQHRARIALNGTGVFYLVKRGEDGPRSFWRAYIVMDNELQILPPLEGDEWEVTTYDPRTSAANEVVGRILRTADIPIQKIIETRTVVL